MNKIYILFLTLFLTPVLYAAGESSSELFNSILPAEYVSVGKAIAGSSSGASSCWANPAGMANAESIQYSISGMKWLSDINLINGSILFPLNSFGNISAGIGYLGSKEEDFESIAGDYDSTKKLNFNNLFFSLGYGRHIVNAFPVGIGLKFINSEIGLNKKLLLFADVGSMIKFNFLRLYDSKEKNFTLGVMLRNIELINYESDGFGELRIGFNYKPISKRPLDLSLLTDIWSYSGNIINYSLGGQILLYKLLSFSVGFLPSSEDNITFGTGFKAILGNWRLKLDYSINPALSSGLNMTHWLQLSVISKK